MTPPAGRSEGLSSAVEYYLIKFVHDNPLFNLFRDPHRFLREAGLEEGLKVMEVGCGPGFFTLPAAEIVGPQGAVYAVDLNARSIRDVQAKVRRAGLKNVTPLLANAARTGLDEGSLDLAFLFGLPRVVGGLDPLLLELKRVLKPDGLVAVQGSGRRRRSMADKLARAGFALAGEGRRVAKYRRSAAGGERPGKKK